MASSKNCTTLRLLHYPCLPDDKIIKPGQIRCGEHTDYGSITLLFQDNMPGLEVSLLLLLIPWRVLSLKLISSLPKWFSLVAVYLLQRLQVLTIYNVNRTEWSPIWSVIIRVTNKIGQLHSAPWSINQTMAKFEKETKHRLYNFLKKATDTRQNARQQQAHMTQNVHFYRQDVHTVLLVIKSGRW